MRLRRRRLPKLSEREALHNTRPHGQGVTVYPATPPLLRIALATIPSTAHARHLSTGDRARGEREFDRAESTA